jgi:hypothetical protein
LHIITSAATTANSEVHHHNNPNAEIFLRKFNDVDYI